jgi:hypothetical protein
LSENAGLLKQDIWNNHLESYTKNGLMRISSNVKTFGSGIRYGQSSETATFSDGKGSRKSTNEMLWE